LRSVTSERVDEKSSAAKKMRPRLQEGQRSRIRPSPWFIMMRWYAAHGAFGVTRLDERRASLERDAADLTDVDGGGERWR
jgi:hypothetical protein